MDKPPVRRENRKHARVSVRHFRIFYRLGGFLRALFRRGAMHKASILDCSEGGLKLIVTEPLELGSPLDFSVQLSFMPRPFICKGHVVRCHEVKDPGRTAPYYEVGISMDGSNEQYLKMMKRLQQDPLLRQGNL